MILRGLYIDVLTDEETWNFSCACVRIRKEMYITAGGVESITGGSLNGNLKAVVCTRCQHPNDSADKGTLTRPGIANKRDQTRILTCRSIRSDVNQGLKAWIDAQLGKMATLLVSHAKPGSPQVIDVKGCL